MCASRSSASSSGASSPGSSRQGAGDQPVREPHVLRQQRAVQVGADRVAPHGALHAAAPVVAIALQHAPERALRRRRDGFARRGSRSPRARGSVRRPVRRRARPRSRRCRSGEAASSRTVSTSRSPTPGIRSHRACRSARAAGSRRTRRAPPRPRRGRVQRIALALEQVLGAQALVAVLATAQVEEVVGLRVKRLAQPARLELEADARATGSGARARAGCRGRRRCS